ncbi:hypothetical protein, partial [Bacillus cereus group sp. BC329]|uniref:hypothetical protein n=1 Tax=Bacillus cereus group sp. BC329 TaxID=3445307 RepID=UPI003F1EAC20
MSNISNLKSRISSLFRVSLLLIVLFCSSQAKAQNRAPQSPPLTRILFVFDASFSMFGQWQSGMKMDLAKKLL